MVSDSEKRKELREELIEAWEELADNILDLSGLYYGDDDYYDDEDNYYDDEEDSKDVSFWTEGFSYELFHDLVLQTKEYFNKLSVKGSLNLEDCKLYESANALRFLYYVYEPENDKEEILKICSEVNELFENLESLSK